MKKLLLVVMVITMLVSMLVVASAAEQKGDLLLYMGAGSDGAAVPTGYKEVANGVQFSASSAYTTDPAGANGAVYTKEVDVNSVKVEFSIDKLASQESEDCWVSLSFLNTKGFFNVAKPTDASGLVTLIRSIGGVPVFQIFSLDDLGFALLQEYVAEDLTLGKLTVELKRDSANSTWHYFVNGKQIDDKNQFALLDMGLFSNEKAYVSMGASNLKYNETTFTLNKVQGTTIKLSETATSSAGTTSSANPSTGDAGVIIFAAAALVSGATVIKMKKTKSK